VELTFDCIGARPGSLRYRALFDALPAHVHYARIFEGDELLADRVITDRADTWRRGAGKARRRASSVAVKPRAMFPFRHSPTGAASGECLTETGH